ncbi:hypothetical protein IE4872_PD01873 (plasmid) [Rhizobium gallicum]|uniref:Uncharacterized protein n=1 Tax=Rhizobium gallicum TaxID=56730 RepID=A0A1L5NWW7_9HYPH|nr:hypothetical protein IE4872_PD01873 [Rhizobium gallicum]
MQFTPQGSPSSIHFGTGLTSAAPGSASGLDLVVSGVEAARRQLIGHGVEVSEIFHGAGPGQPPVSGLHPEQRSYFSHAMFSDPEVTERFPGCVDGRMRFPSPADLTSALRRAIGRPRRLRKAARPQAGTGLPVRRIHGPGASRRAVAVMKNGAAVPRHESPLFLYMALQKRSPADTSTIHALGQIGGAVLEGDGLVSA